MFFQLGSGCCRITDLKILSCDFTMIFNYIKNPSTLIKEESNGNSFWKNFPLLFFKLLAVIFVSGVVYSLISFILDPSSGFSFPDNYTNNLKEYVNKMPLAYLWIILIGPAYEEITFRMGLDFERNSFVFSLFMVLFLVTGGTIFPAKFDSQYIVNLIFRVVPLMILYFTVGRKITQKHVSFLKERYYNQIVYLVAIVFSVLHLPNYFPFHLSQLSFYILIMSVFFYISMTLSYIRIKHGLAHAIVFHTSWNLFQMLISR